MYNNGMAKWAYKAWPNGQLWDGQLDKHVMGKWTNKRWPNGQP